MAIGDYKEIPFSDINMIISGNAKAIAGGRM